MTDVLKVEPREQLGTSHTRRLRKSGRIPAVIYGHGKDNVHVSAPQREVLNYVRTATKTLQLEGAGDETVLVSDVQWDPLGIDVLHLDLVRVDLKQIVTVTVPVNVKGQPVGVKAGGIFLENLREVEVQCAVADVPDSLVLIVSKLEMGEKMTAGDLEMPAGVTLVTDADSVIAQVEIPRRKAAELRAQKISEAEGATDEDEV
ncbi:MAG: 50S ribosomal protein L25 [Planctomycetota bacterium]